MRVPFYNKLIRDKIPDIIRKNGGVPNVKKMIKSEYRLELLRKAVEEAKEIKGAEGKKELIKEIADMQEILDAIMKEFKLDRKKVKEIKCRRKKERGGFEERIYLISVE